MSSGFQLWITFEASWFDNINSHYPYQGRGRTTITLDVTENDTIQQIKQKIQDKTQIPAEHQRLENRFINIVDLRHLRDDNKTLKDYWITTNEIKTLWMHPKLITWQKSWTCMHCELRNSFRRTECQACFRLKPPQPTKTPEPVTEKKKVIKEETQVKHEKKETIWKTHTKPQFYDNYDALPSHLLEGAHHRLSCHEMLNMVHGNQTYWKHEQDEHSINPEHKIWYLNSVCWLEFSNKTVKVPSGKYAVCIRIKLDKFNFNCKWAIGHDDVKAKAGTVETIGLSSEKDDECMVTMDNDCVLYQHAHAKGVLSDQVNKGWVWMHLGDFEIKNDPAQMEHNLNIYVRGGYKYWCSGLGLDVIEIYKLDLEEYVDALDACCELFPDIIE
eukprot:136017_1